MIIFDLASESKFDANRKGSFRVLNRGEIEIRNSWKNFLGLMSEFLSQNEYQCALVMDSTKISKFETFYLFLNKLNKQTLTNIDLFQIQHNDSGFLKIRPVFDSYYWYHDISKVIPSFLVSYQAFYKFWLNLSRRIFRFVFHIIDSISIIFPKRLRRKIMSRVSAILAIRISKNVGEVMNYFNVKSEIVFHSFEDGLDCFIISRRLAEHLTTINNPPLLDLNTLLSAVARTQNLRVLRFCGNPFK